MSCFKKQKAYCIICGIEFESDYSSMKSGSCCDMECLEEHGWRHTLCIMGKDYYPRPKSDKEEIK